MRRALVLLIAAAFLAALAAWGMRSGVPAVTPPNASASQPEALPAMTVTEVGAAANPAPQPAASDAPPPARSVLPHRPPGVVGTVRDPAGSTVANAVVMLLRDDEQKMQVPLAEISGADGVFRVGTRAVEAGATLVAQHDDYPPASLELTDEHVHGAPIELRFASGVVFTGRLVDTIGRPVAAARVVVSATSGGPLARIFDLQAQAAKHSMCNTDRDGRFTCRGWPSGAPAYIRIESELDRKFEVVRPRAGTVDEADDADVFVIDPTDGGIFTLVARVWRRVRIDVGGDASGISEPKRARLRATLHYDDGDSRRLRLRWDDSRFRANSGLLLEVGTRRTCDLVFRDGDGVEQRFGPYVVDGSISIGDLVLR